jgi:hypothetical protein
MEPRQLGKLLVVGGLVAVLVGALVWTGLLSWFGHLPGDLRFEGERTRVYVPITSMIVASVVLTLISWVVRRLG